MRPEAVEQYNKALKAGQKYYKPAIGHGEYPYLPVLDEMIDESKIAARMELGVINIPLVLVVGTKTAGRTTALAGNFMPLLTPGTEFAAKWMSLCDAHLSDEGISDPIQCYEYMGLFYVEEGNKRVSVMRSFGNPSIMAKVTRLVPVYSSDYAVQVYYEFMQFYALSGLYGIVFRHKGQYARLQALLGLDEDYVWSEWERRSFTAGYAHFSAAFEKVNTEKLDITPAEAMLAWLEMFSFAELKALPQAELIKKLQSIWPDIKAESSKSIALIPDPEEKGKTILTKLINIGSVEYISIAFIFGYDPKASAWTRAHDHGRKYLKSALKSKVRIKVYRAPDKDEYYPTMEKAIKEGAKLIFATTPNMVEACRRIAADYPDVKVLNCALSFPYTGVRMYYSRLYEAKFITGAVAGAMAREDVIGYVANYPIVGVPADINAFALGVKLTNPRARIKLRWSCLEPNPVQEFIDNGITVISNRDATNSKNPHWALEWGTYRLHKDGSMLPLAVPCWNWGKLYEKIVLSIFDGSWGNAPSSKAINYWWGMRSGVIDVQLSDSLPDGLHTLANFLKRGIIEGSIDPFFTRIVDQKGRVRNNGNRPLSPDEIMSMDWLCDNVDGCIPGYDQLMPQSRELVRLLGIYRDSIPPEKEEKQL
jgi:basic membrane lipoprotein Med (substrate-binding protein (PBP1-ABC) superfamily)